MQTGKLNAGEYLMSGNNHSLETASRVAIFKGGEKEPCDKAVICKTLFNEHGELSEVEVISLHKDRDRCSVFEYYSGKYLFRGWYLLYHHPLTGRLVRDQRDIYKLEPIA